jgi:hypothetical protein
MVPSQVTGHQFPPSWLNVLQDGAHLEMLNVATWGFETRSISNKLTDERENDDQQRNKQ